MKRQDGRTHWEGCEAEHHDCALARLEDARKERDAMREYLDDICDAYDEWVKVAEEAEDDEDGAFEIMAARNNLDDNIQRACDARQEP